MYDITAIGEALIDFSVVSVDESGYPTLAAKPGGAPANFLSAAAAFGCSTSLIAKVGDDVFGHLLTHTIRSRGIETAYMRSDPDCFTTLAFVTIDPKTGERQFDFSRKPGADTRLSWQEISPEAIEQTRVFHFGTLSLSDEPAADATKHAVARAKALGKLISFDPNLRKPLWNDLEKAREAILWGLRQADVVKISDDEIEFLYHCSVEDGVQKILENGGPKVIFGTMGRTGCRYLTKHVSGFCPAFAVSSVDATGAGDIFGGTALALLLHSGKELESLTQAELHEIVRTASGAAALSTMHRGGISSIRTKAEVMEFLT